LAIHDLELIDEGVVAEEWVEFPPMIDSTGMEPRQSTFTVTNTELYASNYK